VSAVASPSGRWLSPTTRQVVFTPVATPDGPRYELEGVAEIGRLLALDDGAKWASLVDEFRTALVELALAA
jgi:hypothetical protein